MFVSDIRKDFFDVLQHERILLIANLDVDAVCAVKILQTLLQCDNVQYTLVPVQGKADLIRAFEDNGGEDSGVRYAVLVNCGASVDLVDFLDPPEDLVIFVADSHRPIDVCNAYNDGQIRLLALPEDIEEIPKYEDVFRDGEGNDFGNDDNGDSSESDENSDYSNKKSRFDEKSILKRRDLRLWEEDRGRILFEYQQFSYTGISTAFLFYELAWKMSRDNNDLLWWAIVGHTEQLMMVKSQADKYIIGSDKLRDHVSRLNLSVAPSSSSAGSENSEANKAVGSMRLSYQKELNLNLYRHWSLYESLQHSIYTASKFKIWTLKGKQKLSEFLAELGLPIVQCKQKFATMDLGLRTDVRAIFEEKAEKYALDDITFNSFTSSFGFRHRFCAGDVVYAVMAILENRSSTLPATNQEANPLIDSTHNFLEAIKSLSRGQIEVLETGIEKAKERLILIMRQVQTFLDLRTIVCAGPFFYAVIQDGTPDSKAFGQPNLLAMLAMATLKAHATVTGGKKVQSLPLVVSAPLESETGKCLIMGVPPLNDSSRKNLMGKAFEQAAKRTGSRYLMDYFDAYAVQLKTEDRSKFFDGLVSMLN